MADEKEKKEKELFEAALNALNDDQIFEGKFGKAGEKFQPSEAPIEEEVELVKEAQDIRLMEDAFGFVEKRDHSKYWIPENDADENSFENLLNEQEKEKLEAPTTKTQKSRDPFDTWTTLADASTDAKVIDLRDMYEASALRELSHRLQAGKFFRVVYGGKNDFTKELLSRYLSQEKFGTLKAVFAFSPDSKEKDGLAIVKIK